MNPEELSGKKVGVFVGNCYSEFQLTVFYVSGSKSGLGLPGCSRSMIANRISYYLNLKGPSVSIDESCCSSTAALEMAYDAIARGECESALVGGANLCLHPQTIIHYGRVVDLNKDGKTKSFDANADGCSMSEAINIIYLQKAKDARRVYAEIVKAKSQFMTLAETDIGANGGLNCNPNDMSRFLNTFYEEANVSPKDVKYVEAFGAASRKCDKMELDMFDEVYCKDRTTPLMVGSVTSNIGYVGAASGISAVTKVLLGYHFGKLAGNLHYNSPRQDVQAIREKRIEVLGDHRELSTSHYTAINGLSITGNSSHVLLKGFNKKKDISPYKSSFARIVLCSGRQESSVQTIFNYLKSRPIDPEELALLHYFYENNVPGHLGRGFLILDSKESNETVKLSEECIYFDKGRRPLWFVYSGMGSQWVGMGKDLMRIPVFAAAIERCHRVLAPKGLNLIDVITSDDKNTFDNIMHSFVGINAIQIALTDVLRALDIVPDNIIGHSVGEIGCAYADGCFTLEEAILCAYNRGLVSIQTPFIRGSMAAVGLGYKEISKICPPEIDVACHNSAESSTISGPADIMAEFVTSLGLKGIFAKEVPCSNIAYHSRYIANAGPGLLKCMQDILKTPRPRSARWVSTSIPQDRWDEPLAKYSSAEYHTNNLLNPVLFEETAHLIPPNAVLIEVAPHGLLQAILKRSLPESCKQLPITRRGHPENSIYLLEAIGRLYMEGFNPKVKALYPQVNLPVSTSTPMLSHLVEWVYQEKWSLHTIAAANMKTSSTSQDVISAYDVEHSHLKGHMIRGKNLYPFSAALVAVWDTLAASLNLKRNNLSVQFDNVYFYSQPILHKKYQLRPYVTIQKGSGRFEVSNEKSLLVTGFIIPEIRSDREVHNPPDIIEANVSGDDIYELLCGKEYNYLENFRSIHSTNDSMTEAQIEWNGNWVTFLDGIIQLNVLKRKHNTISKLDLIRKIVIDVEKQSNATVVKDDKVVANAKILDLYDLTICGGVVMESLRFVDLPLQKNDNIELKICEFMPLLSTKTINARINGTRRNSLNIDTVFTDQNQEIKALHVFLQIVADNVTKEKLSIVEIFDTNSRKIEFSSNIEEIIPRIPGIKASYRKINLDENISINDFENIDILITTNLLQSDKKCEKLTSVIRQNNIFIIHKHDFELKNSDLYTMISSHIIEDGKIELGIWKSNQPNPLNSIVVRKPKHQSPQEQQGGEYYLPLEDENDSVQTHKLKISRIGDLKSVYWVSESLQETEGVPVKVNYVGVNIIYINKLLGTQFREDNEPTKSVIDFSGTTKSGTAVMGLVHGDAISSQVHAHPDLLLPIPEHWTLEDAATVPLAYIMAFYILFIKVRVNSKHTICVQAAAGALGQAVISVALAHGCHVFATVSSNSKKQFLKKLFPKLKDDHIIDHSRDINFVFNILRATNGKGCDLLVSCAKDELKNFSFRCLGSYGIMMDTSVVPNRENYNFGMDYLSLDRVYYPIDLSTIFQAKFKEDIKLIRLLMIDGIRRGYVRPLTRVTYDAQDAPRAFHLHAAGQNRGRVLLDLQQLSTKISPSIACSSSSWQVVVSDNGKLALKLAERLIDRGAKRIFILLDRVLNYVNVQKRQWEEDGIDIEVIKTTSKANGYPDLMRDCKKDGMLESIFVITSNEKAENVIETVNSFANFISLSGYSLKYFALITTSKVTIKPGSWFGTNGLSQMLTKIKLPEIEPNKRNEFKCISTKSVSMNDAIDAVERALTSQKKVILVHASDAPRKTLLEEIMSLADVKLETKIEKPNFDLTLKELHVDDTKLLAIQSFLRDVYEVNLNIQDIQNLSVKSINELEKHCIEYEFEENKGIATYFPALYNDELLYTTDMLFMPTLAFSAEFNIENNPNKPHLCIIPGVEGYYESFSVICERLKLPAIALQPGLDHPYETVPDLANRYINVLKKKAALNNNFYLLGYESGVLVALEMAAILEKSGLIGTVFCIGGSPTEIFNDIRNNLREYETKEQLQIGVLKHAYSIITAADTVLLDNFCENLGWPQKVDKFMDMMSGKLSHSMQYTRKWIDYIYIKLLSLLESGCVTTKISSQIISLRPQYSTSMDLSLQNHSHKKVITYQLESPLSYAHLDMRVATIINSHLDHETLELFNKRNICKSYPINTETVII
ncbi:fatty acid synthase-like [Aricia agestis]|uniref:fatty acid synthase-like n=1 Tax=Aricia agestis TaxID=91739 RepID=UPI001C20AAD9|nr:fatty acid synthase-like [Aricia agestis]